jgi:hypothetical protein
VSRGRRRRRSGSKRDFWGVHHEGWADIDPVRPAAQPVALVGSLGPPPLGGNQEADHYFALVYDRASGLAQALAASAGLLEVDDQR